MPTDYQLNDGTVDIATLSTKRLILVGEDHRNIEDENLVRRLITDWKPDYVLCEALGDLVLETSIEKSTQLRLPSDNFYYGNFTKHWISLSCEFPMPFIGMEYTQWKPNEYKNIGLKATFIRRESHFIKTIDKYLTKGKVLAICGDTHLRTINTRQLGQISPLYTKYSTRNDSLIIRTRHGEID